MCNAMHRPSRLRAILGTLEEWRLQGGVPVPLAFWWLNDDDYIRVVLTTSISNKRKWSEAFAIIMCIVVVYYYVASVHTYMVHVWWYYTKEAQSMNDDYK